MDERTVITRSTELLVAVFRERFLAGFAVRFWNGDLLAAHGPPAFTLVVNSPEALRAAFSPPADLNAGRAFVDGSLDVEGDIERALALLSGADATRSSFDTMRILAALSRLPRGAGRGHDGEAKLRGRRHSPMRDRAAIAHHYDRAVEFYETFLDRNLVYSCGYFGDPRASLDEAQEAKLDYVLRKLRVRPGDRFLDIGCGWGALAIRAAQKFGANALGITLSAAQHAYANRRIAAAGLSDRVRVELRDYRDLGDRQFDAIASIGMVEHVGRSRLREYFARALRALRPGGLFLNHGIAEQSPGRRGGRTRGFIDRFVFPDGELVAIGDLLAIAERNGFEVRDVENLREHYVLTLRAWIRNLERNRDRAQAAAGIAAYRTWRLYMAGSAVGFDSGTIAVFQSLLGKPDGGRVDVPLTRDDLYAGALNGRGRQAASASAIDAPTIAAHKNGM